jgi:membrane protein DedA with SNARE-associated domain/rhodanese-related sulfurtransferase
MNDLSSVVSQYGLAIVFANVFLDQLGLPIPAIPTLVVAGAFAIGGKLSILAVFVVAVAGSLAADAIWYLAGRHYGNRVMRMLCMISLTPDSCVSQTQAQFERWGANALLVAKFVPGISLLAPPLSGAAGLGWLTFLAYNTAGAALWVMAGMGGGMLFGPQIERLFDYVGRYGGDALIAVVIFIVGYVGYKWWERRRFYAQLRMARISVEELHRRIDEGDPPIIVDVRSHVARTVEPRHIPGALHLPMQGFESHIAELPREREIILYCSCPNEASAAQIAKLLMNAGFRRVRPLLGGLEAWIEAGHPVDTLAVARVVEQIEEPTA